MHEVDTPKLHEKIVRPAHCNGSTPWDTCKLPSFRRCCGGGLADGRAAAMASHESLVSMGFPADKVQRALEVSPEGGPVSWSAPRPPRDMDGGYPSVPRQGRAVLLHAARARERGERKERETETQQRVRGARECRCVRGGFALVISSSDGSLCSREPEGTSTRLWTCSRLGSWTRMRIHRHRRRLLLPREGRGRRPRAARSLWLSSAR